jgi:hypothetical protein
LRRIVTGEVVDLAGSCSCPFNLRRCLRADHLQPQDETFARFSGGRGWSEFFSLARGLRSERTASFAVRNRS